MAETACLPEPLLSGKVFKMLCHLYEKVETLEAFAEAVVSSQSSTIAIIQADDRPSYMSFLKSTVVCTCRNARPLPQTLLLQQQSRQDEVVLRVIERIRQREGRFSTNLLVIGYRLMSDDPDAMISSSRSIEYRILNSNTSRLQYSTWKTLLSRIGDDAMECLLETRVIFVPALSTCYVQLTGTPIYELWPFHRYYAQNQRNPATSKLCTSLLNDSRHKSRRRQRRRKTKAEPSPSSKKLTSGHVQSDVVVQNSRAVVVQQENREKFIDSEPMRTQVEHSYSADNTEQACSESESKCCLVKKRKAETKLDAEPYEKRQRIVTDSTLMSNHSCDVGLLTNSELLQHSPSQKSMQVADSVERGFTATFRNQKHRRKRKGKLHDGNKKEHKQKIVAFDHKLIIERTPMFYARDLTEKYPPRYVLFNSKTVSPLKLAADIFSVRVLYNGKLSSVSCCSDVESLEYCAEVKQRLLNIVQLIIRNHQLCRYKHLLHHHCSVINYNDKTAAEIQTHQKDCGSLTTKPAPKLEVPVYCRGHKPSSSDLAATPVLVDVPKQCAEEKQKEKLEKLPKKNSVQLSVRRLLEQNCSQHSVYLFVRACCVRVVPTELFGSAANRNHFFRNIQKMIEMGRYEQLSLGCLMRSMQVTRCRWMKEIRSNTERLHLFAKVLSWLMNTYVMPVVKSYFYVTDSATYRNRMFYYRKSLWMKIHKKVMLPCI